MMIEKPIAELKPHPMNDFLFDDIEGEKWEEFLNSVERQGVMTPLLVTEDGTIVSGHQRWRACMALNIQSVMCRVLPLTSEDDILLALIESNVRQRGVVNSPTIKLGRMIMEMERILGADENNGRANAKSVSKKSIREHLKIDKKVANCSKAIAQMPEEVQELVEQEAISPRTAYDIVSKLTPEEQVELAMRLDPVQKYTQQEIKAAIERFFPKSQQIDEMQEKLAEYQRNDSELELREKTREAQAKERKAFEDLQAERRARKKERQEFEKHMEAMEQLLEEANPENVEEIARLTEERDQYMRDAEAAQNDADLQLVSSLIHILSGALSEVANDPRPLSGALVTAAERDIATLESRIEAIKARIAAGAS